MAWRAFIMGETAVADGGGKLFSFASDGTPVVPDAILQSLWFLLPAYVANPAAVLSGGGRPMDFGRHGWDGRRLLGGGKTWRGFVGGTAAGTLLGLLQSSIAVNAGAPSYVFGGDVDLAVLPFLTALGGLLGDVLGAFVKRRLGLPKGARAPGLDQYDFLLGALLVLVIASPSWLLAHYFIGDALVGLVVVLLVTPLLHRGVNLLGYRLGKKEVPW